MCNMCNTFIRSLSARTVCFEFVRWYRYTAHCQLSATSKCTPPCKQVARLRSILLHMFATHRHAMPSCRTSSQGVSPYVMQTQLVSMWVGCLSICRFGVVSLPVAEENISSNMTLLCILVQQSSAMSLRAITLQFW